jgi:hypothetical protein
MQVPQQVIVVLLHDEEMPDMRLYSPDAGAWQYVPAPTHMRMLATCDPEHVADLASFSHVLPRWHVVTRWMICPVEPTYTCLTLKSRHDLAQLACTRPATKLPALTARTTSATCTFCFTRFIVRSFSQSTGEPDRSIPSHYPTRPRRRIGLRGRRARGKSAFPAADARTRRT